MLSRGGPTPSAATGKAADGPRSRVARAFASSVQLSLRAGHQVVGNSAFTEGGVLKNGILKRDGHGDDVADLMWINGSPAHYAIYGVTGGGVTPPPSQVLAAPSVAGGNVSFRFPTTAGTNYRVEFQGTLGGAWTLRETLAGTGSDLTFSEPVASGGFFRVVVQN